MSDSNIVPVSSFSPSSWVPPEGKVMQQVVKYGSIFAVLAIASLAIHLVVPTYIGAMGLIRQAFTSTISMMLTGLGFVGISWVSYETLSSNGKINAVLCAARDSVSNRLTRMIIKVDPLSPFDQRLKAVRADKAQFGSALAQFDGAISKIQGKEVQFRELSTRAGKLTQAATREKKVAILKVATHDFGSYGGAADKMQAMRLRLEPVRSTLQEIAEACDITERNLETDRSIYASLWEVGQDLESANASANRVLGRSKGELWARAKEAEDVVTSKYAEELGHLESLRRCALPFLESIDLENISYSEELLEQFQTTGTKLITSTGATHLPAPVIDMVPVAGQPDAYARITRKG
jgi:hypothetical protein